MTAGTFFILMVVTGAIVLVLILPVTLPGGSKKRGRGRGRPIEGDAKSS